MEGAKGQIMLRSELVEIMMFKGYFIEPTVIITKDPKYTTMCTELFDQQLQFVYL